jgi:hypothetical protein
MDIFWIFSPCSLVEISDLMMEEARTTETSINSYYTTLCNFPEGSHIHTRRREDLMCGLAQ